MYFIINNKHFNLLILLNFIIFMIFVTLANKSIRLSEDTADALKNAGVLTLYNIYICIYVVHLLVWIINFKDARYIRGLEL